MLRKIVLSMIAVALMICNSTNADAFTIKKGTISFGGSSNLWLGRSDTDITTSTDQINMSINSGYFVIDNLEIGGLLTLSYQSSDDRDSKGFSLSPFVTYHIDLNQASNIYLTGMVGYSKFYYDYDDISDESDGTILSAEIGWEYFFSSSVSGTIGLRYRRMESDLIDSDSDTDNSVTSTSFGTNIGLKIYF
jgi:hypothetical protein